MATNHCNNCGQEWPEEYRTGRPRVRCPRCNARLDMALTSLPGNIARVMNAVVTVPDRRTPITTAPGDTKPPAPAAKGSTAGGSTPGDPPAAPQPVAPGRKTGKAKRQLTPDQKAALIDRLNKGRIAKGLA